MFLQKGRLGRWIMTLQQYSFVVEHKKGTSISNVLVLCTSLIWQLSHQVSIPKCRRGNSPNNSPYNVNGKTVYDDTAIFLYLGKQRVTQT